jgi:hypothetical protein
LKLGPSLQRRIFAFPSTIPRAKPSSSLSETTTTTGAVQKYPFDLKICCLPGLADLAYFKDLITSSTFSLELYQDDLLSRCFTGNMMEEYLKLVSSEPNGLALPIAPPAAGAPPPGKKGGAPAAKGGAPLPVTELIVGPTQPSDKFLIQHLHDSLSKGKLIRPHGVAKFRLEQLLEKSNDLLTKFRRKRHGGSLPDDEHVIVKVSFVFYSVFFFCFNSSLCLTLLCSLFVFLSFSLSLSLSLFPSFSLSFFLSLFLSFSLSLSLSSVYLSICLTILGGYGVRITSRKTIQTREMGFTC